MGREGMAEAPPRGTSASPDHGDQAVGATAHGAAVADVMIRLLPRTFAA